MGIKTLGWADMHFNPAGGLPDGWLAPRREFAIAGFSDVMYIFGFDAAPLSVTAATGVEPRAIEVAGAKCRECGGLFIPRDEILKDHARLHLAVRLAHETPIKVTLNP